MDVEPAKLFVDECCNIGNGEIEVDIFWRALNQYRKEFNCKPISKTMCTQSLQRIDDTISKPKRRKNNIYYYEGINIKDDFMNKYESKNTKLDNF